MGCHQKALTSLDVRLAHAATRVHRDEADGCASSPTRKLIDQLLDQRWDYMHRATEWDAEHWGFDPDRWCEADRARLASRT